MQPPPVPPRSLLVVLAAVLGLAVVGLSGSSAAAAPVDGGGGGADDRPVLYLTFDDGPGEDTPAFLDLLARYDANATFFVTGSAVTTNPATAVRIVADGHAIANHTWNHPALSRLPDDAVRREFVTTTAAIEATTGVTPVCYRPPYGATNARVHAQAVAVGLPNADWTTGSGSHHGLWDVDTNDWRLSLRSSTWTEARMRARLDSAGDGDTILLHDGFANRRRGLAVLAGWLAANHDRFRFETLPGCGVPTPIAEPAFDPDQPEQWHRARIARLYLAYFGRLPDADGWEYWNREFSTGASMGQISDSFAVSAEFTRTSVMTDEEFVTHIYRMVLDRQPDEEGFAYWLDQLAGGLDRGDLVLYFSDGTEFVRTSAPLLTGSCHDGDPASDPRAAYGCWVAGLPTYDW
ncbi:MAG: polysaccharide deacetylase family protein [Actinomycetota bacterium]